MQQRRGSYVFVLNILLMNSMTLQRPLSHERLGRKLRSEDQELLILLPYLRQLDCRVACLHFHSIKCLSHEGADVRRGKMVRSDNSKFSSVANHRAFRDQITSADVGSGHSSDLTPLWEAESIWSVVARPAMNDDHKLHRP